MNLTRVLVHGVTVIIAMTASVVAEEPGSPGREVVVTTVFPRIKHVTYRSTVMPRETALCVVLPNGYDEHQSHRIGRNRDVEPESTDEQVSQAKPRAWPVVIWLHGRGRNELSLVKIPAVREQFLAAPFITIFPRGDDGWYLDSPVQKDHKYESLLTEQLAVAAQHFPISTARAQRALAGWSMGGYGCIRYAQSHAKEFSAAASIIGLLDFPRTDLPRGQSYDVPSKTFGSDEAAWPGLNPLTRADALAETSLFIITGDAAFDRTMNENFSARLKELKIDHRWEVKQGGHTLKLVEESVPDVLNFFQAHFARRHVSRD